MESRVSLRYAANLSMLWSEREPLSRFDAAAAAGFQGVEMLFPQELGVDEVVMALERNKLQMVLFDLNAGDWGAGERGIAILPDRVDEFRDKARDDLAFARRLQTGMLAVLAGRRPGSVFLESADTTLIENLQFVADLPEASDVVLTVEAINGHDVEGFHVQTVAHAARIIRRVDRSNVRMQFDQYHVCRQDQDPLVEFMRYRELVAHVQIADAPGRHEPGSGKAPIAAFLELLESMRYPGHVGLEYHPSSKEGAALDWLPVEQRGL